jgi:beta-galactosidase
VFCEEDQAGNILDFMMEPIEFSVEGPGELIGPSRTAMQGGCIAAWVKTTGAKGVIKVCAKTSRFVSNTVEITVN